MIIVAEIRQHTLLIQMLGHKARLNCDRQKLYCSFRKHCKSNEWDINMIMAAEDDRLD